MTEIAPGWDVVARKTHGPVKRLLLLLLQTVTMSWPPAGHSDVTFTVRNRTTGETRQVTANSEQEAAARIAQGRFDAA
jgi:hypothetical protein